MSSAIESERSKPPSPKRPKREEFLVNEENMTEELRLFDEAWLKSGGFDVDLSKLSYTFGAGSVDLEDTDMASEPDDTNRDWLNRLSMMAISFYKEKTDISLEFVEVLKANFHPSASITLYMTFEANDPSDGNQKKQYQTVIRYLPRDIEVYSCDPRPC